MWFYKLSVLKYSEYIKIKNIKLLVSKQNLKWKVIIKIFLSKEYVIIL